MTQDARQSLVRAWTAFLGLLLDSELSDGTPLMTAVLAYNPDLRHRLHDVLGPTP